MDFPTGWNRRCALVIDHTKLSADQSNFPVLLTEVNFPSEALDADGGNGADNGGGDLRFSSDSAGATQLACEVVSYVTNNNPALATAEVWVKVPSVSSSVDTTFYVWYNNAGQVQPSASDTYGSQNVWDSNYKAVFHGNTANDATSNAFNLTAVNGATFSASGKVGSAFDLESSSSQYFERTSPAVSANANAAFTFECWANAESFPADGNGDHLMADGNTIPGAAGKRILGFNGNNLRCFMRDDLLSSNNAQNASDSSTATWYHFACRVDANGKIDGLYINTSSVASATASSLGAASLARFTIGAVWDTVIDAFFDGLIDEARVSLIERSTDYLTATYNNTNAPSTFVIEGSPVSVAAAPEFLPQFIVT